MATPSLTKVLRETLALFGESGAPRTTTEVAECLEVGRRSTYERLARLVERNRLETKKVGANGRVWWRPVQAGANGQSATAELERQLRSFRTAVQATSDPTYLVDDEGTIEYVNPAFEETAGYSAEEAIGETPQLLRPEEHDGESDGTSWGTTSGKKNRQKNRTNTTKAGERYVVDETVIPVRDESGSIERFVVVHGENTDRGNYDRTKIEREREKQREQLAALSHINMIVHDITDAIIKRSTREEIERTVCESLANVDSYTFAWIGEVDAESQTVSVRAEAGVEGYLDEITISVDPDDELGRGLTGRALRTGEVQTTQDVRTDAGYDPWWEHVEEYDYRSAAAIPIVHGDTVYGVLKVYAERPGTFEGPERAVIGQLGEITGHAIAAIERKQALMSDEIVELGYYIPGMLESLGVDATTDGKIAFEETVATSDKAYLVYGTMTPDARETLRAMAEQYEPWNDVRVISEEADGIRFQIRSTDISIRSRVASKGGTVEEAVLEEGDLHLRVQLPPTIDGSSISEIVTEKYPNARFLSKRQFSRSRTSRRREQRSSLDGLTDRQRAVFEVAYKRGYFEWPRNASGEEIADSLGIAPPTFSQHLRKAEKTLLDSVFSSDGSSNGGRKDAES